MTERRHIPVFRCLLLAALLLPALPATNGTVYATYVQDGVLYIAGDFNDVDGNPRNGLAAIDIATRSVVSDWDPDLGSVNGVGRVLLPAADGTSLYVGGEFATVGADSHQLLAAIDIDSTSPTYGQARSWDPAMIGTAVGDDILGHHVENMLEDFGVQGEIIKVRPGPVVRWYRQRMAP